MIVQMDEVSEFLADTLRGFIEFGPSAWLKLYINQLTLSPNSQSPSMYVEASYAGYAPIATLTTWSVAQQDAAGIWHIESGPWTFAVNGDPMPYAVAGWYLQRGTRVIYAEALPQPYVIPNARPGPTIFPRLVQGSQSVLCPAA